jgi:hypothetical protein
MFCLCDNKFALYYIGAYGCIFAIEKFTCASRST